MLNAQSLVQRGIEKTRNIAGRVDVGPARLKKLINFDSVRYLKVRFLREVHIRNDSDACDDPLDHNCIVTGDMQHEAARLRAQTLDGAAGQDLDALFSEKLGD